MKESRAEQVFESFVRGDTEHTISPLLSISMGYLMQRERGAMKRKMRQQKIVALNLDGSIVYPVMERGASQVLGMLQKVKAHEVDDLAFGLIMNGYREYFASFSQMRTFIARSNPESFVRGFLQTLRGYQIPNPYGENIDQFLAYVNRRYCQGKFTAAVFGLPKSQRGQIVLNEDYTAENDRLDMSPWTFFKDETDALMYRLADTDNRLQFIKLRQS